MSNNFNISSEFNKKLPNSSKLFERFKDIFPNGVCHDLRRFPPFPFISEKGEGAYLFDTDGNQFIDLWMGHYANILGHGHPSVIEPVKDALYNGIHTGTTNAPQLKLAEMIREAIPEMEKMRFCTSGTEATMYVTRAAKAYTGKNIVVKIEGGWHGANTDLTYSVKPPFDKAFKDGIAAVPFNDIDKSREILEVIKDDVAAVILEPVMGSGGGIAVDDDYLLYIKSFCDKAGVLLIFDETITGFRFRYGSISELLPVKPDLFTMGKIIGGGFAIGLYGGRKEIIDVIQQKKLTAGGGTFSAHPIAMTAGAAVLDVLKYTDYSILNNTGAKLRSHITESLSKYNLPAFVSGFGSMIAIHFVSSNNYVYDIKKPSSFLDIEDKHMDEKFKALMLLNGVYTMHAGGALSTAHLDDNIISKIKEAYSISLELVVKGADF